MLERFVLGSGYGALGLFEFWRHRSRDLELDPQRGGLIDHRPIMVEDQHESEEPPFILALNIREFDVERRPAVT